MVKTDFEKVRDYYEKLCKKHKLDPKVWDMTAEYDSKLSLDENKNKVDSYIELTVPLVERATKEDEERYNTEMEKHILEQVHQHNIEHFKSLNVEPDKVLDKIDKPIHDAISKVINMRIPLVVIDGRHGNGKSYAVDTQIKRENAQERARIYTTTVTKAFLYRIGFENRNKGSIIVLRDINPFKKELLDTLKAMTDTRDPRMIYKNAYSKENDDLENSYQFEGSVIIEVNSIPVEAELKQDIEALLSRAIYVPFTLSHDEIRAKMDVIAGEEPWKKEVTGLLRNMQEVDINLRTQYHAFKTYEWARLKSKDWKETVEGELRRISRPKIFWKIHALIGERWVKKTELVKALVTYEGYGVRTAQRNIKDLVDGEIMYEQGHCVGLIPLKM